MKTFLVIAFLMLTFAVISQGQDKKLNFYTGGAFGIYGGSTNDPNEKDSTAIDAGCGIFSITGDYSFREKFYTGITFERNGFLTDSNSNDHAYSINLLVSGSFKIGTEKNKFVFTVAPGFSFIKYQDGSTGNYVTGNGVVFQVGIQWDHFFTENIGMFIQPAFASYGYKELKDKNGDISKLANGNNLELKLYGINLKAGLALQF